MECGGKKKTTNNEMELTAMLECLQFLPKKDWLYKVIVHTDSLNYIANGMVKGGNGVVGKYLSGNCQNWKRAGWKPRANLLLWKQLDQEVQRCYKDGIELEVKWVEAHSGNEGNELADTLAKGAVPKN